MDEDDPSHTDSARDQDELPGAERAEQLEQLSRRGATRSARDVEVIRTAFRAVYDAHEPEVSSQLRRRSLQAEDVEDLVVATFEQLFVYLLHNDAPTNMAAMLHTIAEHKLLNFLKLKRHESESAPMPSSGSLKPISQVDLARAVDVREFNRWALPQLTWEHFSAIDLLLLKDISIEDAAELLRIPEGTLKSRYKAAKTELAKLAKEFFSPSERHPV
jgi:RNA polymerase sigma-70 factor (ECF subfamily)